MKVDWRKFGGLLPTATYNSNKSQVRESTFREHYRVTLSTFLYDNYLVEEKEDPYYELRLIKVWLYLVQLYKGTVNVEIDDRTKLLSLKYKFFDAY